MKRVSPENPIKIYPDGDAWGAFIGESIADTPCEFSDTPEEALMKLLQREDEIALMPDQRE